MLSGRSFLVLIVVAASALRSPVAAQGLVFVDELGNPLDVEVSALGGGARARTARFVRLHGLRPPAVGPSVAPEPRASTTSGARAPHALRADEFVDERLCSYRRGPAPAPPDDLSWALAGTGLVEEVLHPSRGPVLRRLLAEPAVAPLLARARERRDELAFLVGYARRRLSGQPAPAPITSRPAAGRLAIAMVPEALGPGRVLERPVPPEQMRRLVGTLRYFRSYPSTGARLHVRVQRWLIDTRRLVRYPWWNLTNRHIYERLGRTAAWRRYERWFDRREGRLERERLYLAAHNGDLREALTLYRPLWRDLPVAEKVRADVIIAAVLQGERFVGLFETEDRLDPAPAL